MYVVANFQNSLNIELAILGLEKYGVLRRKILAIPLQSIKSDIIFDTINKSDGISSLDTAFVLGTMFMVLGAIYGYVLPWGPIICGLLGLFLGAIIGFVIDIIPKNKSKVNKKPNGEDSVVLLINCTLEESVGIKKIVIENTALSVGYLQNTEAGG